MKFYIKNNLYTFWLFKNKKLRDDMLNFTKCVTFLYSLRKMKK